MNNNRHLLKPCSQCGCVEFEIKHAINKNGLDCYPYFCIACGNRSPIVEKKIVELSCIDFEGN